MLKMTDILLIILIVGTFGFAIVYNAVFKYWSNIPINVIAGLVGIYAVRSKAKNRPY